MRIALLAPADLPETRHPDARYPRELGAGLLARGHEPRLITAHAGPPQHVVEDGLPVTRNWRPPDGRLRRRGFEEHLTHVPLSYLSLRSGSDDVAVAFHATDALASGRWSQRTGAPSVFCHLGLPHRQSVASRRRRLAVLRAAIDRSAAVVAASRAARDAFDRWLGVEARVIHPPVDLERLRPGERASEPTIVCAAWQPPMRAAVLVEGFRRVRREHPAARLVVPAAAGVPEGEGVELRDLDDPAALAAAAGEAWACVVACPVEGFCTAAVEALACGAPVVGPDLGALPEVVDRPEVGRLFAAEEAEPLAEALLAALELAADPGTAAGCRARAEDFSVERCADEHLALYAELGAQSSSVR